MVDFVSQSPLREPNTKFKIEFVDYEPWPERAYHRTINEPWPWEYVQQAERELSRYNVVMTYGKPSCTQEEWGEMMRDHPGQSGAQHGSQPIETYLQTLEINDNESHA